MLREVAAALRSLRPPSMWDNGAISDESHRVQMYEHRIRAWRWVVFYWLLLLSMVGALNSLGWGWSPLYAGHAPRTTVERIEVRLLEQDLLTTRIGQCTAIDKSYFTQRLNELMREYQRLTGQAWNKPDCTEVTPQ